jgi:hypothetical protein
VLVVHRVARLKVRRERHCFGDDHTRFRDRSGDDTLFRGVNRDMAAGGLAAIADVARNIELGSAMV